MSQKQVMPKSEDLSRSLEINAIWTFDTEFPTIFNKSCTYITFKSAVKHRQLGYGYPRGQIVHLADITSGNERIWYARKKGICRCERNLSLRYSQRLFCSILCVRTLRLCVCMCAHDYIYALSLLLTCQQ